MIRAMVKQLVVINGADVHHEDSDGYYVED